MANFLARRGVVLSVAQQHARVCRSRAWHFTENGFSTKRDTTLIAESKPINSFLNRRIKTNSCCRTFRTSPASMREEPWMISDGEVNAMISRLEKSGKIDTGIIDRYETNQLASNQPMEDRKFVVRLLHQDGGYLFGVMDGHGGNACAHNVCKRLPDYIALSLLHRHVLLAHPDLMPKLTDYLTITKNEDHCYNYANDPACRNSLNKYFYELQDMVEAHVEMHGKKVAMLSLSQGRDSENMYSALHEEVVSNTVRSIREAYIRLDQDIRNEAVKESKSKLPEGSSCHAFDAANAGACALVAYIQGTELFLANAGDCRAVLGVQGEDGCWSAMQLSSDHTAGNPEEVQRILNQHPPEESTTVIRFERLLGRLAPLRAFGDARFKWDKKTQNKVYSKSSLNPMSEVEHFYTPPYLTAEPEVMSYQLQRTDKFLVLATDGLWDMLSNEEVVHYVQEHVCKKVEDTSKGVLPQDITFNEQELPCDLNNAASCLVREALGGDDHVAVSTTLSIPYPDVRMYRDDISVIVVFFNWERMESVDVD
ncbi:pyruvate dehydrogenase [acetyl-transferring]-phosphatase 2, mitochondrial [Nematostella vectensis]|uniref:pyruvate dehydrogenase [acetyl-transferring]-phosphatase 2, mitochondrial n=1 Tax=Nematostella vectensis TaxID=45351 RepID=UPI00139027A7|nr:pyruvate dehydrogenase [acetyl-transferring]-phosphatase 2, mitochondrial [Nematostella vectensis]